MLLVPAIYLVVGILLVEASIQQNIRPKSSAVIYIGVVLLWLPLLFWIVVGKPKKGKR